MFAKTLTCPVCSCRVAREAKQQRYCATCSREVRLARARRYKSENREHVNEYTREWFKRNRTYKRDYVLANEAHVVAQRKEYKQRTRQRTLRTSRNSALLKKYGITVEQYELMRTEQGGVCANKMCGSDGSYHRNGLVVDHCHATNKVRRLLCNGCNIALGGIRERADIAAGLIELLKEYEAAR